MKNLGVFCLLFSCVIFGSCKNNQSEKIPVAAPEEAPVKVECYTALYEKDTIALKMNTFKDGHITGNMDMVMANTPKYVGEVAGEFRGDTLFVSYTYIQGNNKETTFKNPMAFLKRDNQLILGNGKIEVTLGAGHFVSGEPIDFDRVKYKLNPVDCVTK
ncbi:hypothetical protein MW871_15175 [Flavobacterium sp. I-SCBP12n]|uniref:Lipoprotein n=1 Tax=Flavobacterium pygoscelis TaxID=2893176 RepID=A0A9X1XUH1_9FLAO|nr:hypothetical protein [Flavobacterium pygoscelis]MCK8142941.1 hypothetical protein [Flavobacterium pygoscelis]MCK8143231.1 hypothetical protein [Flavobacterium pygoscelis]